MAATGLRARVPTAAVGIPLLLGALWLGGIWWLVVAAVLVALASMEFAPLRALDARSALILRTAALLAFVIVATVPALTAWLVAIWALIMVVWTGSVLRTGRAPSAPWSVGFGVAYLAVPFGMLVLWRWQQTPWSLLAFLAVIWMNDIAAYFVGTAAGAHKLAPRISPGKSWEGTGAGLAAGTLVGILLAPWLGVTWAVAALWAAAVAAVSQAGDLFESALKRRAGVKDSGGLLPGHGGVLDRFDGVLVAAPLGYVLLLGLRR